MTIYEQNMQAMKAQHSLFLKKNEFFQEDREWNRLDSISLLDTREESKSIKISYNNISYRLNSSYRPVEEAVKWSEQYKLTDMYTNISMFGLGNAIFARQIINKLRDDDKMFIYEPCADIFLYVIQHFDITDILEKENVYIIVEGINDDDFYLILKENMDWTNVHCQTFCLHPMYDKVFSISYKKYLMYIKNNIQTILINRNTYEYISEFTVKNTIENFKYFRESNVDMDFYDDFPKDVPAIIVSAGPSLNKNIEYLREAKGKAVIIVVDRALGSLLNKNIEPDFVITLDSSKTMEYVTNDSEISFPLLCTMDASISIMNAHKGRKIFYSVKGYPKYIFEKLNKKTSHLNPGGSVSTGAFSVCVGLGFKTIILVGQDLAYSDDNSTHAEGIIGYEDDKLQVFDEVEGIDGKLIGTRYDWYIYLTWLQDAIKSFPDINVIDATEGGAKIQGTKIMKLRDAINLYCNKRIDCSQIVKNKKPTLIKEDIGKLIKVLEESVNDFIEIQKKAKEAERFCEILIKSAESLTMHTNYSQNVVKKISDINQYILQRPVYHLIDSDIAESSVKNLSNIYRLTGDEQQDQIKTFRKSISMYSAIQTSVEGLTPIISKVLLYYREEVKE